MYEIHEMLLGDDGDEETRKGVKKEGAAEFHCLHKLTIDVRSLPNKLILLSHKSTI